MQTSWRKFNPLGKEFMKTRISPISSLQPYKQNITRCWDVLPTKKYCFFPALFDYNDVAAADWLELNVTKVHRFKSLAGWSFFIVGAILGIKIDSLKPQRESPSLMPNAKVERNFKMWNWFKKARPWNRNTWNRAAKSKIYNKTIKHSSCSCF